MGFDPSTATPVVQPTGDNQTAPIPAPSGFDPSTATAVTNSQYDADTPSGAPTGSMSWEQMKGLVNNNPVNMPGQFIGEPLLHTASGIAGGLIGDVMGVGKSVLNYINGSSPDSDITKNKVASTISDAVKPTSDAGQLGDKVLSYITTGTYSPINWMGKVVNYGEQKAGDLAAGTASLMGATPNTQADIKQGTQDVADIAANILPGKAVEGVATVAKPALSAASDATQDFANSSAFKAAGGTLAQAQALAKKGKSSGDVGQYLLDNNIVNANPFNTSAASMTARNTAVGGEAQNTLTKLHDVLTDNNISEVHPVDLVQQISALKDPNAVAGTVQAAANDHINTILDMVLQAAQKVDPTFQTPIPLNAARDLRQAIDKNTNFNTVGDVAAKVKNQAGRSAREIVKNAIGESTTSPDATDLLNRAYWQGEGQTARNAFVNDKGMPSGLADISHPLSDSTMNTLADLAQPNNGVRGVDVNSIKGLSDTEKAPSLEVRQPVDQSPTSTDFSYNPANPFTADQATLSDSLKDANSDASNAIEAGKLLKRKGAAESGNNKLGLRNSIAATVGGGVGATIGGPLGAAVGGGIGLLGGKILDKYGANLAASTANHIAGGLDTASTVAGNIAKAPAIVTGTAINQTGQMVNRDETADQISKLKQMLSINPAAFGKYASPLQDAASRGDDRLAATMYILGTSDPDYRALTNQLLDPNLDK